MHGPCGPTWNLSFHISLGQTFPLIRSHRVGSKHLYVHSTLRTRTWPCPSPPPMACNLTLLRSEFPKRCAGKSSPDDMKICQDGTKAIMMMMMMRPTAKRPLWDRGIGAFKSFKTYETVTEKTYLPRKCYQLRLYQYYKRQEHPLSSLDIR